MTLAIIATVLAIVTVIAALLARDVAIRILADRADARVHRTTETEAAVGRLAARVEAAEVVCTRAAAEAKVSAQRAEVAVSRKIRA